MNMGLEARFGRTASFTVTVSLERAAGGGTHAATSSATSAADRTVAAQRDRRAERSTHGSHSGDRATFIASPPGLRPVRLQGASTANRLQGQQLPARGGDRLLAPHLERP